MKFGPIPEPDGLHPPRSHADRFDLAMNASRPGREHRAMVAALGACWPRYRQEHPFTGDVLQYGRSVWDTLIAAGYDPTAVSNAGVAAFRRVTASLVAVDKSLPGFSRPSDSAPDGTQPGGGSESDSF